MASNSDFQALKSATEAERECMSEGMGQWKRSEDESNMFNEVINLCHIHV